MLFLSDILPTGYQAAEMGEIKGGRDGRGVRLRARSGSSPMKSAWLLGAGRVIAVDHVDYRLDFARALRRRGDGQLQRGGRRRRAPQGDDRTAGARTCASTRWACEAEGSALQRVLGVELKLEAGAATAIDWCIQTVRKGGNVSIIGVYGPPVEPRPHRHGDEQGAHAADGPVQREALHAAPARAHPRGAHRRARGSSRHRFPLQRAPEAYHLFETRTEGCIKCVLLPQGEA